MFPERHGDPRLAVIIDVSLNVTGSRITERGFGCVKEGVRFAYFISFLLKYPRPNYFVFI